MTHQHNTVQQNNTKPLITDDQLFSSRIKLYSQLITYFTIINFIILFLTQIIILLVFLQPRQAKEGNKMYNYIDKIYEIEQMELFNNNPIVFRELIDLQNSKHLLEEGDDMGLSVARYSQVSSNLCSSKSYNQPDDSAQIYDRLKTKKIKRQKRCIQRTSNESLKINSSLKRQKKDINYFDVIRQKEEDFSVFMSQFYPQKTQQINQNNMIQEKAPFQIKENEQRKPFYESYYVRQKCFSFNNRIQILDRYYNAFQDFQEDQCQLWYRLMKSQLQTLLQINLSKNPSIIGRQGNKLNINQKTINQDGNLRAQKQIQTQNNSLNQLFQKLNENYFY